LRSEVLSLTKKTSENENMKMKNYVYKLT